MRQVSYLLLINYKVLLGILLGGILGFVYWSSIGIVWGNYPLSSELWVNCIYGCLFGGLIGSVLSAK